MDNPRSYRPTVEFRGSRLQGARVVMARGRLSFKQSDVVRAIKGVQAAGLEVAGVEIDREGRIVITTGTATAERAPEYNEWDDVLR